MQLELYQRVIITQDYPDQQIKAGDLGWLVDYEHGEYSDDGIAYIEIVNIFGEYITIAYVDTSAIEPLRPEHRPVARIVG